MRPRRRSMPSRPFPGRRGNPTCFPCTRAAASPASPPTITRCRRTVTAARARRETTMQFLDTETIRARLPWPAMLAALDEALLADVHAPLRASHTIEVPGQRAATLLMMPAWRNGRSIGVKLVTVFPGNADTGKRSVSAVYALFDA